jgi:hypothetical protein
MSPLFGIYYCITFWLLVVTEAVLVQRGVDLKSRFAHEDRFIGYLFVAPFIWPFRLYKLARLTNRTN